MAERIYLQLFHSDVPGAVPTGLKIGELGLNVADGIEFYGYGGDINYDVNGNPLPDLPPAGMGWKATGIGGDGPPGPPGPAGEGVPPGGETGQYLRKATDGDYVTTWDDGPGPATVLERGTVYGVTDYSVTENTILGYDAFPDNGAGTGQNVVVGHSAGRLANNMFNNVYVGYRAATNQDGNYNTILGSQAAGGLTAASGTGNVYIGYQAAYNANSANYNVLIGYKAGINIRGGDNNVILGGYYGSANLSGNIVLADGLGNIRFQANENGAWSPNGTDYGQEDFVLTSNGTGAAPEWKALPLAFVSQIIAGDNITIDPADGLGVVTINAAGGGGSGITSLTKGEGITLTQNGSSVTTLTGPGTISINQNQVLTPTLYTEAGSILIGGLGAGGVIALAPGTLNQVLTIGVDGLPYWANSAATGAATPTKAGVVFGLTDGGPNGNVSLGLNAGGAIAGGANRNTLLGTGAGYQIINGDNNTIVGNFAGQSDLQGNVVLADGAGNVRLQTNSSGALSFDGTDFGTAGYVLSSNGPGQPPEWIDPPNAPIQTISDGDGIAVVQIGTNVEISNTGVTNIIATSPIEVSDNTGAITISAPNVLSDLTQGAGITISGTGNTRTITNSGVVQLVDGTNTSVVTVSPGVFKINAAGGGGGGNITELLEGAGIDITSPTGPTPTITNTGVISVASSANVIASATTGAGITFSLQNVVLGTTAGAGISIDNTDPENPVISNSGVITLVNGTGTTVVNNGNGQWQVNATGTAGVTKLIAGSNISLSPTSGTGEVTISAAGGGGGGSITTIAGGPGISINSPTGPTVTVNNTGILSISNSDTVSVETSSPGNLRLHAINVVEEVRAGTGINISGSTEYPVVTNTGVTSLTAGSGIQLSGGTGNVTITAVNSGGTVKEVTSTNQYLTVNNGTGPTVSLTNNGVCTITAGTGITKTGSNNTPTLAVDTNVIANWSGLQSGTGISISGSGNTRTISNTGVTSIKGGTAITASQGSGGEWTINNTGVTKLTAGANITLSGSSGDITISASGGGGGSDITSVTAGYGLTGGGSSGNVTIAVDRTKVVTYDDYEEQDPGAILYTDSTGTDWTNGVPGNANNFNRAVLQGWETGPGTFVGWGFPDVGGFQDSDSVTYHRVLSPTVKENEFYFDVNPDWVDESWVRRDLYDTAGSILFADSADTPTALPIGTSGQVLTVVGGEPAWADAGDIAINVSAPITYTGGTIGFDVDTTLLTEYVPNGAFLATGSLLVGGATPGTYENLNPGNDGQFLSVASDGTLEWADIPLPPPVNLTPADDSIVMDPDPITNTGTIGVTPNKFIETVVVNNPGDMIYGSGAAGSALPARLPIGPVGAYLTVGSNNLPAWTEEINGGTF